MSPKPCFNIKFDDTERSGIVVDPLDKSGTANATSVDVYDVFDLAVSGGAEAAVGSARGASGSRNAEADGAGWSCHNMRCTNAVCSLVNAIRAF